ncbi:MAG TPA: hypothetical protein VHX65_13370 [Pirellulales bacterium]|nr:hypothetical protein [Pirellulales bacterium]
MRPWKPAYDFAFVAVYLATIVGIALWVLEARKDVIAQLEQRSQLEGWQAWRAAAAKQNGTHGPVEREVPRSEVPPMLMLMRDNFPAIFFAATFFPAMILGFFLFVLRGVLRQPRPPSGKSGPG